MSGISYREFARRVGVTGEAVRKAVDTGRIPAEAVGEKTLSTGRKRPIIIDEDLARRSWKITTNPSQQRDKAKLSAGRARAHAEARGEDLPDDDDQTHQLVAGSQGPGGVPPQSKSNAIAAAYKARMAKIDYEERIGKLINAEEAKTVYSQQIVEARNKLGAVGRKAKSRLPHLSIDDVLVIDELIAEALEELSVAH